MPLQVLGGTKVDPMQLWPAQTSPAGSAEQIPPFVRLQDRHGLLQALLQQTPSTQKPDAHWLAALHRLPFGWPGVRQLPI
jgi:hypothetical protein